MNSTHGNMASLTRGSVLGVLFGWGQETHTELDGHRYERPLMNHSKRGFLPNSISPNTELTGGEGVGSSKSPHAASIPEILTHSRIANCSEHSGGKTAHSYSGGLKSD